MSLFDLLFLHIAERRLWAWQRTAASVNFTLSSNTIKKIIFCSVVCLGSYFVQQLLKISGEKLRLKIPNLAQGPKIPCAVKTAQVQRSTQA